MPNVSKTSAEKIVAAARKIIARRGAEALSMQEVASTVGIRAPSLYKHFPNRSSIVQAVTRSVVADLAVLQKSAATHAFARENLRAIAQTHRTFALRSRHLYALVFSPSVETPLSQNEITEALMPLLTLCAQVSGSHNALLLARALTAFAHGFASMELSGAFHLSGDLDRAFQFGLERLLPRK